MRALLAAVPPLDPSREAARQWARQELADPVYAQARPGLLQRAVSWVLDTLSGADLPSHVLTDPVAGLVLLTALVGLVVIVVLLRTGRLRGPAGGRSRTALFDEATLSAADHRRRAAAAAAAGDWDAAVRHRFRAVVRTLEERTVLDVRAGRTADEAAAEAGRALPVLAGQLRAGARVFDDVCYGQLPATGEHDAQLRRLDELTSTPLGTLAGPA